MVRNTPQSLEYLSQKENQLMELQRQLSQLPAGSYLLELGCGHGHFLTALAQKERGEGTIRHYVGVDKNRERIERATRKSERAGVEIHWLNFAVEDVIDNWPEGRGVEEIFVLFPDPWPKERHHKHRFVNAQMLTAMARIASPEARLTFRSDNSEYCDEVRALLAQSQAWRLVDPAFPQGLPTTVFEQYHPQFETLCARCG